jgi:hypothetical protein
MPQNKPRLITRKNILDVLVQTLEPLDYIHALWEGGAAAFNRIDRWSDLDVQVIADDERVAEVFMIVEQVLGTLSPIELKYEMPAPTWHGHAQKFYRLSRTSEFLLVDLAVMQRSHPNKFLQPEIHGQAVIHFDKSGLIQFQPLDQAALEAQIQARLTKLQVTFALFQTLTLKELHRHNDIEALMFYHNFTLRPLIEVLRMKYQPVRYDFYTRYLYYDLPSEVVAQLEPLFFVTNRRDLRVKRAAAEQWFHQTLTQLNSAQENG